MRLPVVETRTVAVTILVGVGLALVIALERPGDAAVNWWVVLLCAGMAAVYALVLLTSMARRFFGLQIPNVAGLAVAVGEVALALGGLWLSDERFVLLRWPRSGRARGTR